MTTSSSNGKATTIKKLFSRETSVSIDIQADKSILWALISNANDFPRWNSTVISLKGSIAPDEKILLKSTLDPKREFKLKVKEFNPEQKLAWGDAMGKRTFSLKSIGHNLTNFTMHEKIGGPLFPLFAGMIPSFDQSFQKFASDLKQEAELINNTK